MSQSDTILLQQSTGAHAYLLNLTVQEHAQYCLKWGIDYQVTYADVAKNRHAFWNKLALILKAVEAGYERVIWLDSDAYIADTDKDLREACPVDGIGATWHDNADWNDSRLFDHWNCGVLYIGAGTQAKRFLKCWWNSSDEGHPWHDQFCMNRTAPEAYRRLWRDEPPIMTLGHEWNSTPFYPHKQPIVAAWHGCWHDLDLRLEAMQAFIAQNKLTRLVDGATLEEARQKAEFCMGVGNWYSAERFYLRLKELGEDGPEFWSEYARCLSKQYKWWQAADAYHEAIRLDPDNGRLWFSLASCYDYLGEHELNGHALMKAHNRSPNMPGLMHNHTLWQLRGGQWEAGFDGLKWQFCLTERIMRVPGPQWTNPIEGNPQIADRRREVTRLLSKADAIRRQYSYDMSMMPAVHEEDFVRCLEEADKLSEQIDYLKKYDALTGIRYPRIPKPEQLFVWSEQGLGDTLMLSRYVPLLNADKIILEVQPPLVKLLQAQCWPGVEVVEKPADHSVPFTYDAHVGMFSLPHIMRATVENTSGEPYLKAPPESVEKWKSKLRWRNNSLTMMEHPQFSYDEAQRLFNVGFSWAGSAAHGNNINRNMQASHFDAIVKTPGTAWFSLQKGIEIPQEAKDTTPEVTWIGDEAQDIADVAGMLANLDLVITIDSAIAHLAGSLGVPCWILLSKSCDWRWLLDRTDTVWYRSCRLYRQSELGGWADVMNNVQNDLRELLDRWQLDISATIADSLH